ncbi:MAG: hypothetical protein ACO3CR_06845 [Solirubrobacterales bacterium]
MRQTIMDRAKWAIAILAIGLVVPGGVAVAHLGETGPGHHADDPPAAASTRSGESGPAGASADGAGTGDPVKADTAPASAPEEPDPDPTVPLLILAGVLAVGTGWVAWNRRRQRAEGA